jgi:hypothetical protein
MRLKQRNDVVFGGLAIMTTFVVLDPLALRPRLSPGYLRANYKRFFSILPNNYEIRHYKFVASKIAKNNLSYI